MERTLIFCALLCLALPLLEESWEVFPKFGKFMDKLFDIFTGGRI